MVKLSYSDKSILLDLTSETYEEFMKRIKGSKNKPQNLRSEPLRIHSGKLRQMLDNIKQERLLDDDNLYQVSVILEEKDRECCVIL